MESHWYVKIAIFIVLMILSAFFSSAETAYFSISKIEKFRLKEKGTRKAKIILRLLDNPKKLLITVLTGNTIVNVAAAAIAALMASQLSRDFNFSHELAIFIEVVVVTFVLLITGEITPKIFAVENSIYLAELYTFPIKLATIILTPLTILLEQFPIIASKLISNRTDQYLISKDELKTLIEVGEEKGALIEEEKEMIHSIFEFAQTSVKEIMIPRTDMVCVDKNISLSKLIEIIREKGHTRIPVYDERVDNIIGILHAKAILSLLRGDENTIDLTSLVRPALFVPESKMIDEMLKDFQQEKIHMAIVVDEYGGTSGLITLEDIIEEIVGEIQDEYDRELPLYKVLDDGSILANAKINMEELNEVLNINLSEDSSFDSLGGFILDQTGSFPNPKDVIERDGYRFIIEKIEKNRIIQVKIAKIDDDQMDE